MLSKILGLFAGCLAGVSHASCTKLFVTYLLEQERQFNILRRPFAQNHQSPPSFRTKGPTSPAFSPDSKKGFLVGIPRLMRKQMDSSKRGCGKRRQGAGNPSSELHVVDFPVAIGVGGAEDGLHIRIADALGAFS